MLIDLVNTVVAGASIRPSAVTSDTNGSGLDFANGEISTNAILEVGAVSGTTPTLDVKLQESTDNSSWSDISGATFTQVTAANQRQAIRCLRSKRYVRAVADVGGTTPSFTMCVEIVAQKKYSGSGSGVDRSPST